MTAVATVRPVERMVLYGTAAAALAVLVGLGLSPDRTYFVHGPDAPHPTGIAMLAAFTASWLLMALATMLPTVDPLLAAFRTVVGRRADASTLGWSALGGVLAIWLVAGTAFGSLDIALHQLATWGGLGARARFLLPLTLVLASVYQLSPLVRFCLRGCRAPLGFIATRWGGPHPRRQAFVIGTDYGLSCLGCCAALMAVMFAVGMSNPLWMVVLGAAGAVQKLHRNGETLSRWFGVALAAAGIGLGLVEIVR